MTYSIAVINQGTATAENVVVDDQLPDGVTYVVATANNSGDNKDLQFQLGDLAPGESASFDIHTTVDTSAKCGETITNDASASASETKTVTGTAEIVVLCVSDLRVVMVARPESGVPAGKPVNYSVIVDNLGPSSASNPSVVVELIGTVPFSITGIMTDVTGTSGGNASCTPAVVPAVAPAGVDASTYRTVECQFGTSLAPLAVPASAVSADLSAAALEGRWIIDIEVQSDNPLVVDNVAIVESDTSDPDNSNNLTNLKHNFACETSGEADLELVKTAGVDEITASGPLTYTLQVTNWTTDRAVCVQIEDTVPISTTFNKPLSDPGWNCVNGAPAGTRCLLDIGTLEGGASQSVLFVVNVPEGLATGAVITNTATVSTSTRESRPENNTDSSEVAVRAPTNLEIQSQPLAPGEDRIYLPGIMR